MHSTLRRFAQALSHALRVPRLGIAGHLSISFVAVAALAGALNFLVQQGASIVEITRIRTRAAFTESVPAQATAIDENGETTVSSTELRLAVEEYARAAMQRARSGSTADDAQVTAAKRALEAGVVELEPVVETRPRRDLQRALEAYFAAAERMVMLADQRRAMAAVYSNDAGAIEETLKASFNRGLRILGRVVARETLVRLRDDFAEILRLAAEITAAEVPSAAALDALTASEAAFRGTLAANDRSLRRAESAEWVAGMHAAFARLVVLREEVMASWHRLDAGFAELARARAEVQSSIKALVGKPPVAEPDVTALAPVLPDAFVGPPVLVDAFVGPPVLDEEFGGAPVLEPFQFEEARVSRQSPDGRQELVAALTAFFLLLVLAISIATVRSIVVPIRRLLKATALLASGAHEPLPRGGIKELDTLAQAFNQMAAELIAVRKNQMQYQADLEERVAERTRQLQELAECDPATGLPNRRHFIRLLDEELALARRTAGLVGVFFLDLDNFKNVNDSMGHSFGDEVLKAVAARLLDAVDGIGFAARLGGDEFTIIVPNARDAEHVREVGLKIVAAFQGPLSVGNRDLIVSVSAGASIFPLHEEDGAGLLKAADAALFRAKALGRNQLALFTPELLAEVAAKFTTEQGLRRAIERGEFELVFQPEVEIGRRRIAVVEALLRWRLPDGRSAAPEEFLRVAEDSGLIAEISEWIVRSAVESAAKWHHGEWPDARVAINVSARQLLDPHFVPKIEALLREFRLPARCIEIELTETVLQTGPATLSTLQELAQSGFAIALDDFGSGYSSLASLEKLPFTRIKLDRSLIDDVATNARSASIARAIIWLCQSLRLEVTAEGVETLEQLAMLYRFRPMYLQGYLLSAPVAAGDVVPMINRLTAHVEELLTLALPSSDSLNEVEESIRGLPTIVAA